MKPTAYQDCLNVLEFLEIEQQRKGDKRDRLNVEPIKAQHIRQSQITLTWIIV